MDNRRSVNNPEILFKKPSPTRHPRSKIKPDNNVKCEQWVKNPNPNRITVGSTAIITLQRSSDWHIEQWTIGDCIVRILRSANGTGAFMLTARRAYHYSPMVSYRSEFIMSSDTRSSLYPASRLKDRIHCCVMGDPVNRDSSDWSFQNSNGVSRAKSSTLPVNIVNGQLMAHSLYQ